MNKLYIKQIQIWIDNSPYKDECLLDWTDESYEEIGRMVAENRALDNNQNPAFLYTKERFVQAYN